MTASTTRNVRSAVIRQLEAAHDLLCRCGDEAVTPSTLEAASFLVGLITTEGVRKDEFGEVYDYLTTIEGHIARIVARARADNPALPDIDRATEAYRQEQERAASLRGQLDSLAHRRESLRREVADYPLREQETAEEIAVMERQLALLQSHLDGCRENADSLTELYRATASPFESMMGYLKEQDFPTLRRTLDADVMGQYRQLTDEISQRLEKLNGILSVCSRAVQTDQKALEIKVEKKVKTS